MDTILCDTCIHGIGDYCLMIPDTITNQTECLTYESDDVGEQPNYPVEMPEYEIPNKEFTLQDLGGAITVVWEDDD